MTSKANTSSKSSNLLGPQPAHLKGRKTLVLDLDETLIHSSYGYTRNPDIVLPIRAQGVTHMIHINKRPGVEKFLARVSELYEVVVFTASLGEYAAPLMKKLDKEKKVSGLLFREACTIDNGHFVKDLSRLGRDLKNVILVDNAVKSFEFQPENAYHIKDFFDDNSDNELEKLIPFLEYLAATEVDDVRPISANFKSFNKKRIARANLSNPNQEQSSPDKQQQQKRSPVKRKGKRKDTEKMPLNNDAESSDKESPREEVEALKVIRNLSLRRTILKNQLKTLDKVALPSVFNPTNGSACTASTASAYDKEISASIQTPEFFGGQRLDHFADTPEAGEGEEDEGRQQPIEKNGGMLSRILEFAEMKKQEYDRFDTENEECERKAEVIEADGQGTMQELLSKEEGGEVTFHGYSEQEIRSEAELFQQVVRC